MRQTCAVCKREFEPVISNHICDFCHQDAALCRAVRGMPSGTSLRCGMANFTSDGSVRWSVGNDLRSTPWGETPESVLQEAGLHNALVIVRDENGWKDYAVAFSMNRPTLDGDVVYANDCASLTEQLLSHYPGRDVYYYDGQSVRYVPREALDQLVSTE